MMPHPGSTWVDAARRVSLADVARRCGVTIRGRYAAPCPGCGLTHRGSTDTRGPLNVGRDDSSWNCQRCEAGGGPLELASWYVLARQKPTGRDDWQRLREWFGADAAPLPAPVGPRRRIEAPALEYPHPAEVADLWSTAQPLDTDSAALRWLVEERGFRMEAVDRAIVDDLARVIPDGATLPPWARIGRRTWLESGHRVLVPLFDATGAMRSFVARFPGADCTPKSVRPADRDTTGLVMAEPVALRLLRKGRWPELWEPERTTAVIAEGEMDWLAWATFESDSERDRAPAVFGVFLGSWTAEHTKRVPKGAAVALCLDQRDGAPDGTAQKLRDSIPWTRTWESPIGSDACDYMKAGGALTVPDNARGRR